MAIDPSVPTARYEMPRSALELLKRHAAQFTPYIVDDYKVASVCFSDITTSCLCSLCLYDRFQVYWICCCDGMLLSLGHVRAPEILESSQQPGDGARGLLCARNRPQTGQYVLIQTAVWHGYILELLPQSWHWAFRWYFTNKYLFLLGQFCFLK